MFNVRKNFKIALFSTALMSMGGGAFATSDWVDYGCDVLELASPQVCFYTGANYTGNRYCEVGNRTVNEINKAPWKNNIESIKLIDGASVKIYNEYYRMGDYMLLEKSTKVLGDNFYNRLRSYRTVVPEIEEISVPSWWYQEMCNRYEK